MKIYVHIGSDKTGTTSIQNTLTRSRNALKKCGILYPQLEKAPHQEILARELLSGNKGPGWEAFEKHLKSSNENVILSSEMLCGVGEADILRLKDWLNSHEVKIIAYIRKSDEYLESGAMQRLKSCKSRVDFFRLYRKLKWLPAIFNPLVYISGFKPLFVFRWSKVFGKENLYVRPYCKSQWVDGNLISDFMSTLGFSSQVKNLRQMPLKKNITPNIYTIFAMSTFATTSRPSMRHQFSEVMTQKYGQVMKQPVSSRFKRYMALAISNIILKRVSSEFNCPPPVKKKLLAGFAPGESSIAGKSQQLLLEFSIHQKKQVNRLRRKLALKDAQQPQP
ncbi:hypothetical protein QT397_17990 [Microbulbifer sp. MKSA007]|nr:hypothetical protein QT397_17990 [Microbulbifer sp. MKSA007]